MRKDGCVVWSFEWNGQHVDCFDDVDSDIGVDLPEPDHDSLKVMPIIDIDCYMKRPLNEVEDDMIKLTED